MKLVFLQILVFICFDFSMAQPISKCSVAELEKLVSTSNDELLVINFWATFCKPCVEELPHFIKAGSSYKEKKVRLILISVDAKEMYPKKIVAFAKRHHLNAELKWLNETDANYFCPAVDSSWSGSIPATLFINKKTGKRSFVESEMSSEELIEKITEMLSM